MLLQSGIQGFYDPAPSLAKSLRVRYEFRGHMHYAEIPDYIPVVLPLEGMFVIISDMELPVVLTTSQITLFHNS